MKLYIRYIDTAVSVFSHYNPIKVERSFYVQIVDDETGKTMVNERWHNLTAEQYERAVKIQQSLTAFPSLETVLNYGK